MTTSGLYRRVLRRETHSSRSGIAIALAVVLIVLLASVGSESVLRVLGRPALLTSPNDAALAVLGAPVGPLTAVGAVAAAAGILLIVISAAPGRRGRRGVVGERTGVVVDDRVIAQRVAEVASIAGDVDPDQVTVTVTKRAVRVDVTRTSGRDADLLAVQGAVDDELHSYDYRPTLRGSVRMSKKGTVH